MLSFPCIRVLVAFLALRLATLSSMMASAQDIDQINVEPRSRLLTVFEFLNYLNTEVGVEFEAVEEYAEEEGITIEELFERAEESWQDASMFEYKRAVRDATITGEVYPFIVCDEQEGGDSGVVRRLRLENAIRDAALATNVTIDDEIRLETISNGDNGWCGFANLNGIVAEAIEGSVVQPFVMAMKMAVGTVDILIESLESRSNVSVLEELENLLDEDGTRKMQEERDDYPSFTVTLCSSILSEEDYLGLVDNPEGLDWTKEMIDWLLVRTNIGGDLAYYISQEVYYANPSSTTDTDRAKFWTDVIRLAFEGDRCVETYRNRLRWTVLLGDSYDSAQALLVEFLNTDAETLDDYCVLGMLAGIAVKPGVCQLEITPEKSTSNYNAQWMTQTGVENVRPFFDVGLDGSGEVVAVSDTGIDVFNCYFNDPEVGQPTQFESNTHRKITQYNPFINDHDYKNGHGTHVCGTIAGKRADAAGLGDGVAPGAKLAFIDIGYDDGSLALPSDTTTLGTGRGGGGNTPVAHIHSASWGSVGVNGYSYQARSFDNYMYENDDFLVVVAAGNSGRYDVLNTVGAPATAKNVLAVGASHSFGGGLESGMLGPAYIADFSSRGPTRDGRMKPDVVAPGKYVLSAAARPDQPGACDEGQPRAGGSKGGLLSIAGTSMATPVTSGTAALVRQYFSEGWYGDGTKNSGDPVSPSGALVKAVLMNGAQTNMKGVDNGSRGIGTHITGVQPYGDAMGFGRISLTHSLYIQGKSDVNLKFWDREMITYDGLRRYPLSIDTSNGCKSDQLSVTLVWVEKGSAANCVKCLVNDLDLYVTKDGDETTKYYPNGLSTKDDMNNAERVIVNGVVDGDSFTVTVDPYNLDTAQQKFSLVATGCFGGVANTIDTSQDVFTTDASEDNKTRTIIIIVCSVVGGLIVLCGLGYLIKRRRGGK